MRIIYGSSAHRFDPRRKTIQIILAIFLIIIQYFIIITLSEPALQKSYLIWSTAVGCSVAAGIGLLLIAGVGQYPGVEESTYIVPSFCVSYGMLLFVYAIGRLEYSRIMLTSSFLVNVLTFLVLFSLLRRRVRLRIGLVPDGEYAALLEVCSINWEMLNGPDANVDGLNAISVDLRSNISDDWERQLAQYALRGLPVYHSKHLLESLTGKVQIEHLSENSFGTLSPLFAYTSIKHIIDVVFAIIALIALSPILLLIALWIVIDSPGPALFMQDRIGYQGKPFRVFKFRSMTTASDQSVGDAVALEAAKTKDGDQRITCPGAFLRRTRLDELPQLLNVIQGKMSWIGPRPEAEVLSRWYENEIPFYRYRHIVRPGITGWAQVNQGHVAEVSLFYC